MSSDVEYQRVWQTWSFCVPHATETKVVEAEFVVDESKSEMRHKVQKARIECRMALCDLAQQAKCDLETLAAYERGDDVLNGEIMARIMKILNLK